MNKTGKLALNAMLAGIIIVLGLTPLGLIPLGFINITTLCIPVIAGTLIMGIIQGMLYGFLFGTVSMLSMLGLGMTAPSMLAANLFAASPALAILMCYIPRLLVPLVAHTVFKKYSAGISAFAASLTNTVMYLGLMWLFYAVSGLDTSKIIALILGTGFIAGGAEAFVAFLLVPPIYKALSRINSKGD